MREPAPSKLARPGHGPQKAGIAPAQRTAAPNAPKVAAPPVAQSRQQRPGDASRRTIGLAPGNAQQQLSPAERQRFEEARRAPILRSPVFAGVSNNSATRLAQPTFRGTFAESRFGRDRHHRRNLGLVLGFVGPVFWPYAYDDLVDYTFSPYAYDTFWPYAFDDVYTGIFGGYAPEYYAADDVYAYAGAEASERAYARFAGPTPRPATASGTEARICAGQAQGITDFSINKIAQQVQPDQKQQDLLNKLKKATGKAVAILQDACPTELPSTPTGRLDEMLTRVNAMLQAVQTVRPALDDFYQSLSDEQRERFNMLDQNATADRTQRDDLNRICGSRAASANALPAARMNRSLKLNSWQETALKQLQDASAKAADTLNTKCQADQALTPTGRLAAMEDRLVAMSQALTAIRAALNSFYSSLSDEQKARFDRMPLRATS
jgi:LTXXQ motif family protein